MSDLIKPDALTSSAPQPEPAAFTPTCQEEASPLERIREFYYGVILRHKWLILLTVLAVLPLAVIQTSTTTPMYRSTVTLQFEPYPSNVLPYKDVVGGSGDMNAGYMQDQAAALKSRILAKSIVERLDQRESQELLRHRKKGIFIEALERTHASIAAVAYSLISKESGDSKTADAGKNYSSEWMAVRLLKDLNVEDPKADSQILPVSVVSHNPELANKLVETAVEEFIRQSSQGKFRAATEASEFLEKQIREQKTKLEKAEEKLIAYAKANGILDFDKDRGEQTVMQRMTALNTQLTNVQARLNTVKANYEMATSATLDNFPPVLSNAQIDDLERRISALRQKLADLSTKYGPRWPDVIEVREQVGQLEAQLREEKKNAIEDARSYYQTTAQEYRNAMASLESHKRLAERQNESLIQYKMLLRDENTNRQLYDALLQRSKEAGVSTAFKPDNIRVIDRRPAFPNEPFSPRTSVALLSGLVLGLALGAGCAFILTALDNTVKIPEDVETKIGLPALGLIPTIRSLKPAASASENGAEAVVPMECEPREPAVIPWRPLASAIGEPLRSLRTSILLSQSDRPPSTILITSALPGEGKTVTAINLGIVLAQTGARTLVMEMDMRKPRLSQIFGIKNKIGMSVYLSGNISEVTGIVKTAIPNLYVLTAGAIPPNPAELIGSHRAKKCLAKLRQEFNYIVIDTPPVLPCTDAVVLSKCVDGVVLIARSGRTPRKILENAAVQLMSVGGKILGVALNDLDLKKPEYAYHFGRYYQHYPYYYHADARRES